MLLRHDSLYSVCLPSSPSLVPSATSPPPVLQLRLTEHALSQLAAACCSDGAFLDPSKLPADLIQLDLGSASTEAALVIGPSRLPLQRSADTAPHEVYRLDEDEALLSHLGNVSHKLSVKSSHVTASAASRLKERKEEEDLRKERKRAVVVDQPISAAKLKRKSAGIVPSAIGTSALSRSSSLNKISLIRQGSRQEKQASPSPLRGRDVASQPTPVLGSPAIATSASHSLQSSPEAKSAGFPVGSSHPSRFDRAQSRLTDGAESHLESGPSDTDSASSPPKSRSIALDRQVGSSRGSSFGSAASASAAKKGAKLTTRQRLAKAAKGGSRLLGDPDKKVGAAATAPKTATPASSSTASRSNPAASEGRTGDVKTSSVARARAEPTTASASLPQARAAAAKPGRESVPEAPRSASRTVQSQAPPPSRSGPASTSAALPKPPNDATKVRDSRSPTRLDGESLRRRDRTVRGDDVAVKQTRARAPSTLAAAPRQPRQPNQRAVSPVAAAPPYAGDAVAAAPSPRKRQRRLSPSQPPTASPSIAPSAEPSRSPSPPIPLLPTVKGVGPGAAHWLEPWLDVRSRADWHRLAARFSKTCDEYRSNKRRLDEERVRLDEELDLAKREEDEQRTGGGGGGLGIVINSGPEDEAQSQSQAQAQRHNSPKRKRTPTGNSDASLEEGEMASDEEVAPAAAEETRTLPNREPPSTLGLTTQSDSSRTRSTSPEDHLVWRTEAMARGRSRSGTTSPPLSRSGSVGHDAKPPPPPLAYKELKMLADRHRELHGSLARMQKVLVEFKGRFEAV
ncbi:hypothetical protein ACQY0O_000115 [Thecaphora frezii]